MPELCRFLGISIYMYFNDHDPPHFHVKYNEYRASLSISELNVIDGLLPHRVLMLVIEWAFEHRNELMKNWLSIKENGSFQKIKPLE